MRGPGFGSLGVVFSLAAAAVVGVAVPPVLAEQALPTTGDYVRVYTGDDGESHFETVKLPLEVDTSGAQPIGRSSGFNASSFSMVGAPGNWDYTWHTAPRRQFVIVIRGTMEVEVNGGVKERFEPGAVLLADDTTGRGHMTRSLGEEPLLLGVVPVAD